MALSLILILHYSLGRFLVEALLCQELISKLCPRVDSVALLRLVVEKV